MFQCWLFCVGFINGLYLYSTFIWSTCLPSIRTHTHSHTSMTASNHARPWGSNLGFSVLLKDTLTCGQEEPEKIEPPTLRVVALPTDPQTNFNVLFDRTPYFRETQLLCGYSWETELQLVSTFLHKLNGVPYNGWPMRFFNFYFLYMSMLWPFSVLISRVFILLLVSVLQLLQRPKMPWHKILSDSSQVGSWLRVWATEDWLKKKKGLNVQTRCYYSHTRFLLFHSRCTNSVSLKCSTCDVQSFINAYIINGSANL